MKSAIFIRNQPYQTVKSVVRRGAATVVVLVLSVATAQAGPDERPGARFTVAPRDMPKPFATRSASNPPARVARPPGATLRLPAGFSANIFADGLDGPRWMAVAPNGDVFLTALGSNAVLLLRDADGDGRAETRAVFATGFSSPHGLALHGGFLYVADSVRVWRVPYRTGDTVATRPPRAITPRGALGAGGGHWTRNIAFAPDGRHFYIAVGSRSNLAEETAPRASVQKFRADGSGQRTFADGLRNPVGIAFRPGSRDLYVVVNERDGLGDGLVPDYLTRLVRGGFYGWPYSYIGANPQPGFAERRPDRVRAAIVPDLLFQAHSAPLGLVFYDGAQFPAAYRGDAFVALHGSWNAATPTGYKVVRVRFRDGRPAGGYENFATGFWAAGSRRAQVWGRPVGLAMARDGSLLIADDAGGVIWRVRYRR